MLVLATNVLLARYLGRDQFGIFVVALSLVALLRPVATLAVEQGILRFGSAIREPQVSQQRQRLVCAGIAIGLSCGTMLALFVTAAGYSLTMVSDGPWLTYVGFAWALPFMAGTIALSAGLQLAGEYPRFAATRDVVPASGLLLGAIAVMVAGADVDWVALVFVASWAAALSAGIGSRYSCVCTGKYRIELKSDALRLIRFSWPLLLASLAYIGFVETDRILVGVVLGTEAAGTYGAASVLGRQPVIVLATLGTVFMPRVAKLMAASDGEGSRRLIADTTLYGIIGAGVIVAVLVNWRHMIMDTLFGAQYEAGVLPLTILWLGQLLVVATGPTGEFIQMAGRRELVAWYYGCGLVLNVLLDMLLLPHVGIVGAAIATVLTTSLVVAAEVVQARSLLGRWWFDRRHFAAGSVVIGALILALANG